MKVDTRRLAVNPWVLYAVSTALTAGIFVLDLMVPLGYAEWVLYFIPLLLLSRASRPRILYTAAGMFTLLMVLGLVASSRDAPGRIAFARRSLGIGMLWIAAHTLVRHRIAEGKLKRSEEELIRAQGVAQTGNWRLDVRRDELLWSGETYRIFGIREGTPMTYEAFLSVVHPEDREYVDRKWTAALKGEPYDIEHRILVGHDVRWVRERAELDFDTRGVLLGGFGAVQDITEKKRMEEALRRSHEELEDRVRERTAALIQVNEALKAGEARYRMILATTMDGFWITDQEGRFMDVNDAACRHLGYTREELLGGMRIRDIEALESPEEIVARIRKAREEGPERFETLHRRKDGTLVETEVSVHYADTDGGRCFTFIRDITECKRAEEALKESEERFRTLVEHSLVGFFIVQKGEIVFMNPAQERIFGPFPEGLALEDLSARAHLEDRERFGKLCGEGHLPEGNLVEAVLRFHSRDLPRDPESLRWAHCRAAPIAYGGKEAILVNMIDITQLKEMERIALSREKMVSLGQVAAGVAHEIRNPLSGLNIHLSALGKTLEEGEGLEPEIRETVRTILKMAQSASSKIDGVVRRVMDLANPAPPKMGPVSVNACMRETIHLAAVTLRKAGIRLTMVLQTGLPKVRGDACLIEQVLLNLLTNAVHAAEGRDGEKRIEVSSGVSEGHVTVSVADSGPGVPESIRSRILEPFFTTKKEGTGIGLSFSHRVVSDHGGFIRVGTSRFGGALFTVGLPAGEREEIPAA